jgi:hypothetical protein
MTDASKTNEIVPVLGSVFLVADVEFLYVAGTKEKITRINQCRN